MRRVTGLGSAKGGASHWYIQRVTAVALVLLGLWFVAQLFDQNGADFLKGDWRNGVLQLAQLFHVWRGQQVGARAERGAASCGAAGRGAGFEGAPQPGARLQQDHPQAMLGGRDADERNGNLGLREQRCLECRAREACLGGGDGVGGRRGGDFDEFDGSPPSTGRSAAHVLFLGWIVREKGVYDIVEAMPEVLRHYPNARFTFCGNKEVEELRRLLDRRGLSASAEVPGWVDGNRRLELLKSATVFVLPSYSEGLPNVILTPHIGGTSQRFPDDFYEAAVEEILTLAAGRRPRSIVNASVAARRPEWAFQP